MTNKILAFLCLPALLTLSLSRCAPVAKMETGQVSLPAEYAQKTAATESAMADTVSVAKTEWRSFFPDTVLQGYIVQALANNHSLLNTLEKISMVQNEVRLRKGAMLPSVSAGTGAHVQKFGNYTIDGMDTGASNLPNASSDRSIPNPYREFGIGVDFQWEVDLWGKFNQRKKAAANRWMASVEAAKMAQTLLIAALANNYFELVGLDQRREIITKAIRDTEVSCKLTFELKQEGEVTQLAVDQFDARLLDLKGLLLDNQVLIQSSERAICLLMGIFPKTLERTAFFQIEKLELLIGTGIPSQLLTMRPDIKSAELELAAANYDVSAARRAFFPSLTLGGSGGFNAFDVAQWFAAPASLAYNVGLGITAPIFNQNKLNTMWRNARSNQRIALNNYHETVLKAYGEVTGLIAESELTTAHRELQNKEIEIGRNAVACANELFRLQFIGYLEVLAADAEFFNSQLEYTELITHYCKIQTDLYRALGGGVF